MKAKVIATNEIIYDAVEYVDNDGPRVKGRNEKGEFMNYFAESVIMLPSETQIMDAWENYQSTAIITPVDTFDWKKLEIETAARIYAQRVNSCYLNEALNNLMENSCNAANWFVEYAKKRYNQNNEQE